MPSRRAKIDGRIEAQCKANGIVLTDQRRFIAQVIAKATDHPDILELHRRVRVGCKRISLATVYRTLKLFEDAGIVVRHTFPDSRPRYERAPDQHHDHLIDRKTGKVIEFRSQDIERLQAVIAHRLGYRLIGHRLELYAVPRERSR